MFYRSILSFIFFILVSIQTWAQIPDEALRLKKEIKKHSQQNLPKIISLLRKSQQNSKLKKIDILKIKKIEQNLEKILKDVEKIY